MGWVGFPACRPLPGCASFFLYRMGVYALGAAVGVGASGYGGGPFDSCAVACLGGVLRCLDLGLRPLDNDLSLSSVRGLSKFLCTLRFLRVVRL